MIQTNNWISFSIFAPRKNWPRLLSELDVFLNSDSLSTPVVRRIVEFNNMYGSNIRLFVLPATGKSPSLTTLIQTFFQDNLEVQLIPAMHSPMLTGNTTALAIRVLLSDIIIGAFKTEAIDDDALFTMALYLHLTLLKKNKAAISLILSCENTDGIMKDAATTTMMGLLEVEYSSNRELLDEIKSDIFHCNDTDLPGWLPAWIRGYETITGATPEQTFPAIYRCTCYLIMKQLGLTGPLVARLEYFIKKMAEVEIIHF